MKKEFWLVIILAIVIVVLGVVLFLPAKKVNNNSNKGNKPPVEAVGIQVTSPKEQATVSSPLKISGTANGGGWAGFEGQVGTVQLLDKNGKEIAKGILTAKTDWTKPPVSFETILTFTATYKGQAVLFFSNENPSGDPAKDKKYGLPVILK